MKTSLNVNVAVLEQITAAAQSRGVSNSDIIVRLIQMAMDDIDNAGCIGRLVQYQKRQRPEDWHVFHVKIREDVYEYWLDLRKLLKMSVSLILANAVKKFLGKILNNNNDNYCFINYIITKNIIDNTIIWKLIWGFPPNLKNFINF